MKTMLVVLGIGLVGASCAVSHRPPENPTLEPGLQLYPSPREFDGPGQIFLIDSDGIWRPVVDLSAEGSVSSPQREAIPSTSRRRTIAAGLLMSFAEADTVSSGRHSRVDYTITTFGAARDRLQLEQIRTLVRDNADRIAPFMSEGKLYVIAETVWADSVQIQIDSDLDASVKLGLTAVGAATPSVTVTDSVRFELVRRFERPLRVFYKPYRLEPRHVRGTTLIDLYPVDSELPIRGSRVEGD